jgi:hypothetical protein
MPARSPSLRFKPRWGTSPHLDRLGPAGCEIDRLDCAGPVEMDHRIELRRQVGLEVVTHPFGTGR